MGDSEQGGLSQVQKNSFSWMTRRGKEKERHNKEKFNHQQQISTREYTSIYNSHNTHTDLILFFPSCSQ